MDGKELSYFYFSNHVDFILPVRSVEIVSLLLLWNINKCFLHWFFGTKRATKRKTSRAPRKWKNFILMEVLSNKAVHNNFYIYREPWYITISFSKTLGFFAKKIISFFVGFVGLSFKPLLFYTFRTHLFVTWDYC